MAHKPQYSKKDGMTGAEMFVYGAAVFSIVIIAASLKTHHPVWFFSVFGFWLILPAFLVMGPDRNFLLFMVMGRLLPGSTGPGLRWRLPWPLGRVRKISEEVVTRKIEVEGESPAEDEHGNPVPGQTQEATDYAFIQYAPSRFVTNEQGKCTWWIYGVQRADEDLIERLRNDIAIYQARYTVAQRRLYLEGYKLAIKARWACRVPPHENTAFLVSLGMPGVVIAVEARLKWYQDHTAQVLRYIDSNENSNAVIENEYGVRTYDAGVIKITKSEIAEEEQEDVAASEAATTAVEAILEHAAKHGEKLSWADAHDRYLLNKGRVQGIRVNLHRTGGSGSGGSSPISELADAQIASSVMNKGNK